MDGQSPLIYFSGRYPPRPQAAAGKVQNPSRGPNTRNPRRYPDEIGREGAGREARVRESPDSPAGRRAPIASLLARLLACLLVPRSDQGQHPLGTVRGHVKDTLHTSEAIRFAHLRNEVVGWLASQFLITLRFREENRAERRR